MKTRLLILGLCCTLAAISCTSIDDSSSAPRPVTITLSREDAVTKTQFTVDDKNLNRSWKEGDAVAIIYQYPTGTYNYEKFVLISGKDTQTGTFKCDASKLPTDAEVYVHVRYPYSDEDEWTPSTGVLNIVFSDQGSGTLANLGKYDLMVSTKYNFKFYKYNNGVWDVNQLEVLNTFLHIPAGTQFLTGSTGSDSFTTVTVSGEKIANQYKVGLKENNISTTEGPVSLSNIELMDGKAVNDIYISIIPKSDANKLTFTCKLNSNSTEYVYSLERSSDLTAGKVYHLGSAFTPQAK